MNEFVDESMEPDPRLNQITSAMINAAIAVHRDLHAVQVLSYQRPAGCKRGIFINVRKKMLKGGSRSVAAGFLNFRVLCASV